MASSFQDFNGPGKTALAALSLGALRFSYSVTKCLKVSNDCYLLVITGVHDANGLAKLVAKELNLKPKESKLLLQFLKLRKLNTLTKQLEEKIGCVFRTRTY